MKDLERVYHYLRTLVDLSPEDMAWLEGRYQKEIFRAKDLIFREGEPYQKVTFILKGLVKKYYLTSEGKEFIKEFTWEGQITTPYASLLQKTPASYTMEALEETELLTIDYAAIEKLFHQSPKWMEIGKAFSDFHFLNREAREMELLKYSATERYEIFKRRFPNLLGRLKKQDIASYLGITPVSLSRLENQGEF
jgi:CRP-like cAMP-binding protein